MGNYQRLLSDSMELVQANRRTPFGMTEEMWSDLSADSGARRGAHFVLSNIDVYPDSEMVVEEAAALFGTTLGEIEQHIQEVAKMEQAK